MPSERLILALDQIGPGDWAIFERFAAEYLAVEYPSLRTMASSGGDKGRDGELYLAEEEPDVAIQYSVTPSWQAKIRATAQRLSETRPSVRQLIFASNQVIGPAADELKPELRTGYGLSLDVRDRSWFVEREFTHPQRQIAAEELAVRFVDPLLSARGVRDKVGITLDREEARIGLLQLALDAADRASEQGLTRSSFQSLVMAALRDTTADDRLAAEQILEHVAQMTPAGDRVQVEALTRSALDRLTRKHGPVHFHKSTKDYCLSREARLQMQEGTATFLADERALEKEIEDALARAMLATEEGDLSLTEEAGALRRAVEKFLVERGEAFATAAMSGEMWALSLEDFVKSEFPGENLGSLTPDQVSVIVHGLLDRPTPSTQRHLRRLADAYTLFAFLRQTPDVQKVVVRLFADGDIWLDTSVVLPLLAETLLTERLERHFTVLIRAALDSGLRLYVTDGVIEEVERHINRCVAFSRTPSEDWRTNVPFLYAVYASTGRARGDFVTWVSRFAGRARPLDDVRDYLAHEFGIRHHDLKELSDAAPLELRVAVQEIWYEAHDRRRARGEDDVDRMTLLRLVSHDVENCVGIIVSRRREVSNDAGYRAWLLTLDRVAFTLSRELRQRLGPDAPLSPAMTPDFLTEYLRIGPLRAALERDVRVNLPLMTDISRYESIPMDLIKVADEVRLRCVNADELQIRREVRDAMDAARLEIGRDARRGLSGVRERMIDATSKD